MRFIDPPSRVFSTDEEWVQFWLNMLRQQDQPECREQLIRAETELRRRGFNIESLVAQAKRAQQSQEDDGSVGMDRSASPARE